MSYQALYRKFRPATFDEVRGQDAIVTTLRNQIKNDRMAHAYLFCGTRGTGKTSIAKLFAKAVNCENPRDGSPCGQCASCRAIAAGASLNVVEMDAASNNGVEDVRKIVDEVSYSPTDARFRIYIIDEVHMLSTAAFNALLKTLEEPPSYVIFILATTEVHKIPITILSRCQRYDFRRLDIATMTERMRELVDSEGVAVEEKALSYIARCADGSMRDALSLLDQCIAFNLGQELTYDKTLEVLGAVDVSVFSKLLGFILSRDVTGAVHLLEDAVMKGRELSQFVVDFIGYLRNLMLVKSSEDIDDVVNVSTEHRQLLKEEASRIDDNTLMRFIRVFSDLSNDLRYSSQKRVLIEMTIIRLCRPQMDTDLSGVLDRIRALEEKLEKGNFTVVAQPAAAAAPSQSLQPEIPSVPLPKAVSDDIKKIVSNKKAVANELPSPLREMLGLSRLSVENDVLLVVFDNEASCGMFKQPANAELFSAALKKLTGKEVSFDARFLKKGDVFEHKYPDLSGIAYEVEVVEE
ncbi:MAG: DNA polymerase III subunit gamma/tau [Lachnospiraceae bacterium]|nr:DNA polymerase III subunit gamma/tau [Lachnospiraceae bacterium]